MPRLNTRSERSRSGEHNLAFRLCFPGCHPFNDSIAPKPWIPNWAFLRSRGFFLFAVWVILSAVFATTLPAQTFGVTKGFKAAEPYGPPYEKQIKSFLESGKALMVPGGAMLSDGVTLHTFTESNTLQLVVKAEHCFYNSTNHAVNSAGPLQMQTADGKFSIEGEGFYWQPTNSSLVISNKVHTLIQADLLQSSPTNRNDGTKEADNGPLSILSDRFNYDGISGHGIWRDNVRVNGTNLALKSAMLTAEVPAGETNRQVRSLDAEGDVIVDYKNLQGAGDALHATGKHFNYAPDTGLVRLSGGATWQADQREGRGEELVIDRTNHIFQVNTNAWLRLPGQSAGEPGFLSSSNPGKQASPSGQSRIEIACDRYEIRTNEATFRDRVRLEDRQDGAVRGWMTCRHMTATFGNTNDLQTIIADKDVIIEQGDKRFTGGRAFYTQTNTTLEMTQNPTWRSGARDGKGEVIRLNTQRNEMTVCGKASLRLPATELAGQIPTTNRVATVRPAKAGTNQIAEIFCEQYTLRTNTSVFRGGVYATHPEMNWSCEQLTVELSTTGTTNLVAVGNVGFDFLTTKGKVHGTGDKAVYSFGTLRAFTNGLQLIDEMKLTGAPAVLTSTNRTVRNPVVIWDRAMDKLTLPGGEYEIQGSGPAISTNTFLLPNTKLAK
jgi:lipopolysaccharide export system protein LptA